MKKSQIFLLIVLSIISLILLLLCFIYKGKTDESYQVEELETIKLDSDTINEVYYVEGNEDLKYNYLTNTSLLDNVDLPYIALIRLGDELNDYLKKEGYTSQAICIKDVKNNEPVIIIHGEMESGNKVEIKYNLIKNEFSFILQTN